MVTPAQAGVQKIFKILDSRFRGNDSKDDKDLFPKRLLQLGAFHAVFLPVLYSMLLAPCSLPSANSLVTFKSVDLGTIAPIEYGYRSSP